MSTETNKLFIKERVIKGRLNKLIENGKKTALAKRTQAFYETKITELKALWEEYSQVDLVINETLLETATDEGHEYLAADHFGNTEVKYAEYLSELTEGLRKCLQSTSIPVQATPPSSTAMHEESVLPKIALPKYNGDYDLWRSFHDLFVALVHNNVRLTPVQKLYHLKTCLIGDGEKLLRHTPITNEDYLPAWNKLRERYENKRILVNHQLKVFVNQPKLLTETAKGIKSLLDTTEESLQQLKSLDVDTSSWDVILNHLLMQKLPFITLKLWEEEQGASQDLPTYKEFNTFLKKRLRVLEAISDTLVPKQVQGKAAPKEITRTHYTVKSSRCPACNGAHFVQKCPRYQRMDTTTRRKVIKTAGRCLNCLSNQHNTEACTSKHSCFKCHQRHHTSLHKDTTSELSASSSMGTHGANRQKGPASQSQRANMDNKFNFSERTQPANGADELSTTQSFVAKENCQALLSTVLIITQSQQGQTQTLRCLVDTGSQSSFITKAACQTLCALRTPASIAVTGLNTSPAGVMRQQTKLKLRSRGSDQTELEENFLIINKITDPLPTQIISKGSCQHLQGLELADPTFWKPGKIDALLGVKVYAQIIQEGIRRGPASTPVAIKTLFGWILLGSTPDTNRDQVTTLTVTTSDGELSKQLQLFWEEEEIPAKKMLTKEDQECEEFYKASFERLNNGKYCVKLPFVNNELPLLGESRPQALKRFLNLQRQFERNPELERDYTQCLNEYIELGHMTECTAPTESEQNYYIPHHAVLKEGTTTRLRVVFDASARTTNGKSLNDFLLKGPTLQPKLFATLLKWRQYKIAMHADIEKMYRMVKVHPGHQTFQRIIWKHPTTREIQDYKLTTVTFGTSAAPYLAIRTLQQLAEDEQRKWPLASKAAYTDFYVDDFLSGADNFDDAKELQTELISMLATGGFNLRKWSSNEPELVKHLPLEHQEITGTLEVIGAESVKTLGIRWYPASDCFLFNVIPRQKTTKRTILSDVATLYDPIGWLAPIIIVAKILLQTLWVTGCNWDNPVPKAIEDKWEEFKAELCNVQHLKIPRWVRYSTGAQMQLHGFCDASAKAYAAVLYLRVQDELGNVTSHLLTSKTKVAPIKPVTIPRLELNGALILARLVKATVANVQLQDVPIIAWTDSMIVLQWIKEHPSRWKTYVANRVVEIQDTLKYDQWRHIRTNNNPADLACRGTSTSKLIRDDLWWHGPTWLTSDQTDWPSCRDIPEHTDLEAKQPEIVSFLLHFEDNILLRYSSFTRLKRIMATIRRFIHNIRNPQGKQTNHLTAVELQHAEFTVLKLVQDTAFAIERNNLLHDKPLPNNSRLKTLNPFLDSNGLVRLGGRLDNAALPYARKHPIILPQDHHVTRLIIDKIHLETLHGGPSLVLNTSRHQYWILDARRCITIRLHKCVICARHRNTMKNQLMGNLPASRVNITKPFSKVGIDYAGPVTLKASKLRNAKLYKAYFCIFVCMATKAIHIELVSDLTSEAFLAALRRFVARRGLCTDIYSDCGTNFIGGHAMLNQELKRAIKEAESQAAQYLASQAITWHFNPPASPHFGGIWEAGVKSIKHHLRRTLGNSTCTFEEYATVLAQIEACLNSRPLCYIQNNPDELFVLTPGHFLIGQPLNAIPEPDQTHEKIPISQRWKHLQGLTRQFWNKWSKDYLNQLQQRPKWCTRQTNIQKGDIVLVKNENTPPTNWPLGRIEDIYPGSDGLVRVVKVHTRQGSCYSFFYISVVTKRFYSFISKRLLYILCLTNYFLYYCCISVVTKRF